MGFGGEMGRGMRSGRLVGGKASTASGQVGRKSLHAGISGQGGTMGRDGTRSHAKIGVGYVQMVGLGGKDHDDLTPSKTP